MAVCAVQEFVAEDDDEADEDDDDDQVGKQSTCTSVASLP